VESLILAQDERWRRA